MGTVDTNGTSADDCKAVVNLKILQQNDQIKELQTIIRDR